MAPATTTGSRVLRPTTIGSFVIGVGIGLVLVAPVLPIVAGPALADLLVGGGTVVLVGVGALALLMVLLAITYQLYL